MNEKYIQVLLDELYEKKILEKQENGYRCSDEFRRKLAKNIVRFQGVDVGLLVTIIDWIPHPIQTVIFEYQDILSSLIETKKVEKMLKV